MGVRGLTSFIARHAELYLQPYELHDCNLVIDGDNLACNLYKDVSGKNSAFGGDYDSFYRTVVEFFHVLSECNIRPYVLMDGGYEKKKLRTVWQRLRGKIAVIKRIDPVNSKRIFPLMMREVFVDALHDCGVPVMRCVFEADDELAALSRKLNCPVLSYDSDFYIHNVKYIPLVTLTVRAHKKKVKDNGVDGEEKKLAKCDAKHLEKRTKAQRILKDIQVDAEDRKAPKKGKTYKYLDCCVYKIENLFERGSLSKEKLPLFAAMLGNDYIARTAFKSFFSQMKQEGMGRKSTRQHKRIQKTLQWLKHETLDSALEKIVGRLKKPQRSRLLAQMNDAIEGYCSENCTSYEFFASRYEGAFEEHFENVKSDENELDDELDEELEEEIEEEQEDLTEEADEPFDDEDETNTHDTEEIQDEEILLAEDGQISEESEQAEGEESDEDGESDPSELLPQWFKDRLYPCDLPRFLVDLAHLRIYINNPQIEHFPFNDCNEIGIPLLRYIFALLYNVDGGEENIIFPVEPIKENSTEEDSEEVIPYFRYVTRMTRVTNVHTVRYSLGPAPENAFNPSEPDIKHFLAVFQNLKLDSNKLFAEINRIPSDLRLYFLSVIYWIQKTPHADLLHLHALLICLVVLQAVDSKVEPLRDERAFQKRFGKIIKKEKQTRTKEQEEGIVRKMRPEIKELSPPDRMKFISKTDCLLVQENLLRHFHMQEVFKKKYDEFSTTVLHGFAEFQSVVFNLRSLNGLLGNIYENPKMAQSYCGVFLYNIYGLLRSRIDVRYFVQQHIFRWSPMMFEFYEFLWNWCEEFIPHWQKNKESTQVVSKNVLKKRKTAARKKTASSECVDPNAEMVERESANEKEDEFFDLNNKFCTLMKVS